MDLVVPPFDRPLDGLAEFFAATAGSEPLQQSLVERGELELVGPFPSFTIDPHATAAGPGTPPSSSGGGR